MQVTPRNRNPLNPVGLVEQEHKPMVTVGEAVHKKLPDGAVDFAGLTTPIKTARAQESTRAGAFQRHRVRRG